MCAVDVKFTTSIKQKASLLKKTVKSVTLKCNLNRDGKAL